MRTILAIIFMTFATQMSAFEVKLSQGEYEKARGKFLIENLLVGVKALINSYDFCILKEELFIYGWSDIQTNPDGYGSKYEMIFAPNGKFDFTPQPYTNSSRETIAGISFDDCGQAL